MADENVRLRLAEIVEKGDKGERGTGANHGNFKPSVPQNYVRPKPVSVPQKSK